MSNLPTFAVITPVIFLAMGFLSLLGGLAYGRPIRFDARKLHSYRRKLMRAWRIPQPFEQPNEVIEELTRLWRRQQQCFLTGAGVGLVIAATTLLVVALMAPDQALVNAIFGSGYGLAVATSFLVLLATICACLGYTLYVLRYPLVRQPADATTAATTAIRPAWQRIAAFRPWYAALIPWVIFASYAVFIIVGGLRMTPAAIAATGLSLDAPVAYFLAAHPGLLELPIGCLLLMFTIVEISLRAFVRSPERRFTADTQVSLAVNVGVRTQLIRSSLTIGILCYAALSPLATFLMIYFPFDIGSDISMALILVAFISLLALPVLVGAPTASATEALGTL